MDPPIDMPVKDINTTGNNEQSLSVLGCGGGVSVSVSVSVCAGAWALELEMTRRMDWVCPHHQARGHAIGFVCW